MMCRARYLIQAENCYSIL